MADTKRLDYEKLVATAGTLGPVLLVISGAALYVAGSAARRDALSRLGFGIGVVDQSAYEIMVTGLRAWGTLLAAVAILTLTIAVVAPKLLVWLPKMLLALEASAMRIDPIRGKVAVLNRQAMTAAFILVLGIVAGQLFGATKWYFDGRDLSDACENCRYYQLKGREVRGLIIAQSADLTIIRVGSSSVVLRTNEIEGTSVTSKASKVRQRVARPEGKLVDGVRQRVDPVVVPARREGL